MTSFPSYDFSDMSESDIREEVVRPLLNQIGYRSGTANNIRSEVTLKYSHTFLGKKKPNKDPALSGRADYVCIVSGYGQWIVEAKSPRSDLTMEDAQQAHTYAAHPEIGAIFYLLTNGREWWLFRTASPQTPVYTWTYEQIPEILPIIENILGPSAIKKLHEFKIDTVMPIAAGYNSVLEIVGGLAEYGDLQTSAGPMGTALAGLRNAINEGQIRRNDNEQIEVLFRLMPANSAADFFTKLIDMEWVKFASAQEFLSVDKTAPTIASFSKTAAVKQGTTVGGYASGPPKTVLPFDMEVHAFAEAIAFLEGDKLNGTFVLEMTVTSNSPWFQVVPENDRFFKTEGMFSLNVR